MLEIKEVAIICNFAELYDKLRKTVHMQEQHYKDVTKSRLTSVAVSIFLANVVTFLLFQLKEVEYKDANEAVCRYVFACVLFAVVFMIVSIGIMENIFQLDNSLTELNGIKNLDELNKLSNKFKVDMVTKSESEIFKFLYDSDVMEYLVPNWKAISVLELHSCAVFCNPIDNTIIIYDKTANDKIVIKLKTGYIANSSEKDSLSVVLTPYSVHMGDDYLASVNTSVKLYSNWHEYSH